MHIITIGGARAENSDRRNSRVKAEAAAGAAPFVLVRNRRLAGKEQVSGGPARAQRPSCDARTKHSLLGPGVDDRTQDLRSSQ